MVEYLDKTKMHYDGVLGEMKQCFCIGPEKCNDEFCKLVKEHRENNPQWKPCDECGEVICQCFKQD